MTALYRTYRPQTFEEVVGQDAVVRTLRNAIAADRVRQAYLFAGPRGTGKTSMARILAKSLNCAAGPSAEPDGTCPSCRSIAAGTSLDVVEMDAASQRGIDDIREIRDRVVLQPAEGRYKVYILDEAHQLTDAAWNALLKLIEEPPPHLVFVFCTTDLAKVLPTVRSRCQTFAFQRPRLTDLRTYLRRICDGEGIDAQDAALAQIGRAARGSFRDAVSMLDQLSSATAGAISVQDVLQLVGAVEEDALFRLCDTVVDHDPAGALVFLDELVERGQDIGRLVGDLLEHLRHLMLVQQIGRVPDSVPLTDETRERLREQANQLPHPTIIRLIDLLASALEEQRQGGDPRLPLEVALVKVARPHADLSRESLAHRVELLEERQHAGHTVAVSRAPSPVPAPAAGPAPLPESNVPSEAEATAEEPRAATATATATATAPPVAFEALRDAWTRSVVPAVQERFPPTAALLGEARPSALDGDLLTLEFPAHAEFHRRQFEEERNVTLVRDVLYEVSGRRLAIQTALGAAPPQRDGEGGGHRGPAEDHSEEDFLSLLKDTFDVTEVDET